jgi:hypothetical protein
MFVQTDIVCLHRFGYVRIKSTPGHKHRFSYVMIDTGSCAFVFGCNTPLSVTTSVSHSSLSSVPLRGYVVPFSVHSPHNLSTGGLDERSANVSSAGMLFQERYTFHEYYGLTFGIPNLCVFAGVIRSSITLARDCCLTIVTLLRSAVIEPTIAYVCIVSPIYKTLYRVIYVGIYIRRYIYSVGVYL